MRISSINPATEDINKTFDVFTKQKALEVCKKVYASFAGWKSVGLEKRCEYMRNLAAVLREKKEEYGKLITKEMGKPISQAIAEVEKCAWTAEFFADFSIGWLKEEHVEMEGKHAIITFEPLGGILAVMPWNFPFWQALRCAIPAMIAGNVVVLRHSNVVPLCALAVEEAFKLAKFPENVFRTLITDHETVDELIKSQYIAGVSVTGSVETGENVAKISGANLKKTVLELGGSDPFIVLDDADIDLACKNALDARLISNGQSCICAKRFIVIKSMVNEFTQKFTASMRAVKVGDPMNKINTVGPLANKQQFITLKKQVDDAKKKGAKIECGGKRFGEKGFFFEPTVISNIKDGMLVKDHEVFGPVAIILPAKDEEDAVRIANDSEFGLGASIWTTNLRRGERLARKIESGMVFINEVVKSDPRLPFGGIKKSGIGKELSRYGLLEFVNIKPIMISL